MAILTDVKAVLRISGTDTDIEIQDLIDACKLDLSIAGVLVTSDADALIKRAIITYCKCNYGYDNPDAERFQIAYDSIKRHLSLSGDYAYYTVTFTTSLDEAIVVFNNETLLTGTAGTAIFRVAKGNNYEYTVSKTGYITQTGNFDVTANVSKTITLVVV